MTQLVQFGVPAVVQPPLGSELIDSFGRVHSDLRISVTDRCNIRCFYCMPEEGAQFSPVRELLSFDAIERFVAAAVELGINKVRLTGGEPLLRPKLPDLVARLSRFPEIKDLALTTNGVLLAKAAQPLFDAGLRRLNIHLDSLDRERFQKISRRDELGRVLAGIEAGQKTGYEVIKINAVAIKGLSEPDVISLVRFGREQGIEIRFIEFMPLDAQQLWSLEQVLTADEMIEMLEREFGALTAVPDRDLRAPATVYEFSDGYRVGFIASVSRPFCLNCNRLRLTADGKMRNCLFATDESDVRGLLVQDDSGESLKSAIRASVWSKRAGHEINRLSFIPPQRPMYAIGG